MSNKKIMPDEVDNTRLPSASWNISKSDASASIQQLGGLFAIRTDLKFKYLTAVGGGKITDVIHTDANYPGAWEEFKFWADGGNPQHAASQPATS